MRVNRCVSASSTRSATAATWLSSRSSRRIPVTPATVVSRRGTAAARRRRSSSAAASARLIFANGSTSTRPPPSRQAATARPRTRAKGRKRPPLTSRPSCRADQRLARAPAQQDRLELSEQAGRRQLVHARPPTEVDEPAVALDQLPRDRLQTGTGVAERQAGPLRKVAVVRRAVAREVASRELRQRPVAIGRTPACRASRERGRTRAACPRRARARSVRAGSRASGDARAPASRHARPRRARARAAGSRVSGPSSASARSIASTPRSASPGDTPSCASRRAFPVNSGGVVSACSHG